MTHANMNTSVVCRNVVVPTFYPDDWAEQEAVFSKQEKSDVYYLLDTIQQI